jgi:hypothetical protein
VREKKLHCEIVIWCCADFITDGDNKGLHHRHRSKNTNIIKVVKVSLKSELIFRLDTLILIRISLVALENFMLIRMLMNICHFIMSEIKRRETRRLKQGNMLRKIN